MIIDINGNAVYNISIYSIFIAFMDMKRLFLCMTHFEATSPNRHALLRACGELFSEKLFSNSSVRSELHSRQSGLIYLHDSGSNSALAQK